MLYLISGISYFSIYFAEPLLLTSLNRLERDFVVFWGNQYESSDQIVKGVVVLCLQSPLKLEDVRVRLDGTVRHS